MQTSPVSASPRGRQILTVPNLLSLARLGSVPIFVWLFVTGRQDVAVVLYAVGALTDFVDGFIARRTGAVTELGKILDPFADRVMIVALAVALVIRGALPLALALVVIVRDIAILSLWPLVERTAVERIRVTFIGKTATACLFFGLTCLAMVEARFVTLDEGNEIGIGFVIAGAILYWAAAAGYARVALERFKGPGAGARGE